MYELLTTTIRAVKQKNILTQIFNLYIRNSFVIMPVMY